MISNKSKCPPRASVLSASVQMSYYELKIVSVRKQLKQNLLSEMTTLLPDHNVWCLTETVQCISNAVSREANSHLSKKSKESDNLNTAKPLLSETVYYS